MYNQNSFLYTVNYGDNLYDIARYYNTTVPNILYSNPHINPNNLSFGQILTITPDYSNYTRYENDSVSRNEFNLMKQMREAWEQHVYWTRMFIISVAETLKDLDPTTKRLLKNPKDLANIFAPYYGNAVANNIEQLLTAHLSIGGDLVKAAKNRNTRSCTKT